MASLRSTALRPIAAAAVLICLVLTFWFASSDADAQTVKTGNFVTNVVQLGTPFETSGVAVDGAGNVFFSEDNGSYIWEATYSNGLYSVSAAATLPSIAYGITVDPAGNLFAALANGSVAEFVKTGSTYGSARILASGMTPVWQVAVDPNNGTVYSVSPAMNLVFRITRNAAGGYNPAGTFVGGLNHPEGVTVDSAGNVYIADTGAQRVLKETLKNGMITQSVLPIPGSITPVTLSVDDKGNLFLINGTQAQEEIASGGSYTTVVLDAIHATEVYAIAVDRSGDVYFPDYQGNVFRYQTSSSTDFGSSPVGVAAPPSAVNFLVTTAGTLGPINIVTEGAANLDFTLGAGSTCTGPLVLNQICTVNVNFNPKAAGLRKGALEITNSNGGVIASTLLQGVGQAPVAVVTPGTISTAAHAGLSQPAGVAVDAAGNVYVADTWQNQVLKFTNGTRTVIAGTTAGFSGDGGPATAAQLNQPSAVALDGMGNLYIADTVNNRIRVVTLSTGVITTFAGTGSGGFAGDGGAPLSAELSAPQGVAVDGAGNVFIADTANHRVREVNASNHTIVTVAGNGIPGFSGDNGAATSASLRSPSGVALDSQRNLFIADQGNSRIRMVAASNAVITTAAGSGAAGFSGDGGLATDASLFGPVSLTVTAGGDVYIADTRNGRIRRVDSAAGVISTVAGTATLGYSGDLGPATASQLQFPMGVAVDANGNLLIADTGNGAVRSVSAAGAAVAFASTPVFSTSSDSPATETLTNIGNAPLDFAIPDSGLNPSIAPNFYLDSSSTCPQLSMSSSSATLAPGTSCTDVINFTPQTVAAVGGNMVTKDDSLNQQGTLQSVALSGASVAITQSIDFGAVGPVTYGVAPIMLSATGGASGNPVAFTVVSGPGTVSGNVLTVNGTGTIMVAANQAGNDFYAAAAQVQQSIVVNPAAQTVSFTLTSPVTYGVGPIPLSATGGPSGNPIVFSVTAGPGTIAGNTLVVAGGGSITVLASQAGNANYLAAQAQQVLVVNPAAKSIMFAQPSSPVTVNDTTTLAAVATGGDPVTFAVVSGAASISGSQITYTNAGVVTIQASSAASANYAAATPVTLSVTVNPVANSYIAPATAVTATSAVQTAAVNFTRDGTLGSILVVTQGATGKDFNFAAGGTCTAGTAYTAGQACTVNYTLTPLSPGAREGAVVLKTSIGAVLGTSYLGGTGTGPLGLFTTATQTLGISGLSAVRGISLDGYGNLYGFETSAGAVSKFAAGSSTRTVLAMLQASSSGGATAADGAGNLFVTDTAAGALYELVGGAAPAVKVATIPSGDDNLEIDGAGNLYFSGYAGGNEGAIYKVAAGTYQVTTLVPSGFGRRFVGMAVDAAGNLYPADFNNNILYELPAGTSNLITLASGGYLDNPHGVAVDPAGNIYVSNYNGSTVIRYAAGTHAATLLPAAGQRGIALDGSGNLYTITTDATIAAYTRTRASALTFPNTAVGTTRSSGNGVVFENDGNADLVITQIAADAPFNVGGSSNTCVIGTLSSGGSCVIGATFNPLTSGPASGTASITDNTLGGAGTVQTVGLSGTAIQQTPSITAAPVAIDYSTGTAQLTASVNFVGSTVPTGAVTFTVDSGASVAATCAGTTSPLTCTATYSTGALTATSHTIHAALAADTNFTTASGTAALTVTQVAATINWAAPAAITYGTGLSAAQLNATANTPGTFTYSPALGSIVNAGTQTLKVSFVPTDTTNYLPASATVALIVNQAAASVTPNAASKTYGAADPALTGTLGGFLASDNITATYSRTPGETVLGGPYIITGTLASNPALSNYSITYTGAQFTINKAAATVTPSAASKVYGTTDPALTGTLTGFLPADNVTATYTRAAGETVKGGPYSIAATVSPVAVLSNYAITYNTAAFTIRPAPASVTPAAAAKTYGTADPALTGTLAGFLPGDAVTAAYSRATGDTVVGGPYTITATLAPASVLSNYAITYNTGQFTINRAPATVTPAGASKTYGQSDPTLTGTLNGFIAADNVTANYARRSGETVAGGPYPISATLAPASVLGNYVITYNTAQFTINKAVASVTPNAASKTYGQSDPAFSGTLNGFMPGDNVTVTYWRAAGETVLGGPYSISASLGPEAVLSNYAITYNTAGFTITPANASVTPASASKTYGSADPALTGTLTGFLPADGVTAAYSRTAGESVLGGPYSISATLAPAAVLANYNVTYNSAQFTITPAPLTVAANNATRIYGSADPTFTGTISGIVNNDAITATYAANDAPRSPLGSYPIVPILSGTALSNYSVTSNDGTLTVTPATLTVTAANATRLYGSANPTFSGTIAGIVNNDAITADYSTTATASSAVGTYSIVPTLSGAALSNYAVSANNGTLTVTSAPLVVTPGDATRTYGSANPVFTGSITGIQNNDSISATYSTLATLASDPGSYGITAQLIDPQNKLGNYSVTLNSGSFTITKANQTINWATPAAITYATPLSSSQLSAAVAVSGPAAAGAVTYSPAAGAVLDAGVQTLAVNVAGTVDYNPASATVQLTVNKAQPVFSGIKDASLVYHGASVTFAGALSSPTAVPAGQQVAVTVNNVTQNAVVASNGSFTTTFNTSALPVSATGYTVTYGYAGSNDFNPATATSKLTVAYAVCDLYNTAQAKQSGSTYPITVAVCDANNQNVSTPGMVLTAVGWGGSTPAYSPVPDAGNSNGNGTFRNTGAGFMWNLKTTGMGAGNYNMFFTISGDPTLHFAPFAVR